MGTDVFFPSINYLKKTNINKRCLQNIDLPPVLSETLDRSSPHLHEVHDETKSFGSTPLPHPLDAAAKKAIECTW